MQFMSEAEILEHYRKTSTLQSILNLLHWDQETLMPSGSASLREDQLAILATLLHAQCTDMRYVESVMNSESSSPHILRLKKDLAKDRALSADFVERMARASSECTRVWKQARAENNFSLVQAPLQRLVDLNRERIDLWREDSFLKNSLKDLSYYEVLLGEFDPGFRASTVRSLMKDLSTQLKARIPIILEKQKSKTSDYKNAQAIRKMSIEKQRELLMGVLKDLGFDFNKGRIDESTHPFCGGSEDDVRMTTRYREEDFMDSLSGAIHECGHALYEQGLPRESLRTPCGRTDSFALHESQSRLYENLVGRSEEFCDYLALRSGLNSKDLYLLMNWVEPSFIRVDADEVTYNLHIALRMELEENLIEGSLKVQDLPEAWNSKFYELFSLKVEQDSQGCLQDIHWYSGAFGYFPSYSLGNLLSTAIFDEFLKQEPQWKDSVRKGNFSSLREFLKQKVHSQAAFEDTPTRIRKILDGRDLSVESFLAYVDRKYL